VYIFPHSGIFSLIVGLSSGQFVEAGMLGRNGVIGAGAALDGQTALNTAIGQADGARTMIEGERNSARCVILVPAEEASGLGHRPAVGDFVRQVTDIHIGPRVT
jgi:hypothetical protein